MHILSIGECMAELAPAGTGETYSLGFAGDTYNTAWYLARLRRDARVSFLSAVGDDAISQRMRAQIRQAGIDDSALQVIPNRTVGLYMIALENGERSFAYWRGQSAAKDLARDPAALAAAMAGADIIYFSGITLAILDAAGRSALLAALQAARAAGSTIAFDPNLRPRLWSDAAQMTDGIMQGAQVCDIALPSFEDEAAWFHDRDPNATAERYAQAGAQTVIVKDGPNTVRFIAGGRRGEVAVTPATTVIDTTAAGDSFNAGFLAAWADRAPTEAAISAGAALAHQVIGARGALVETTAP